ncbi:MAG: hypothetical protein P8127_13745, partial [Acidobacteriota bacterium]
MIACPACNAECGPDDLSCPKCGASLEEAVDATVILDQEDDHTELLPGDGSEIDHTVVLPNTDPDDDHTELLAGDDPEFDQTIGLDAPPSDSAHSGSGSPATAPTVPENAGNVLTIGETFGDRYRIDKLLGFGGMGAVYKAWDLEVDIPVALKVIRPEMAQ